MQTYEQFCKQAEKVYTDLQEQSVTGMKKVQSYSEFIKTSGQASAGEYFSRREEEPYAAIEREYEDAARERGWDKAKSYMRYKYGPSSEWAKTPEGEKWYGSSRSDSRVTRDMPAGIRWLPRATLFWGSEDLKNEEGVGPTQPWQNPDDFRGFSGLPKHTPEELEQLNKEIEDHRIRSNIEKDWYSVFPNKLVDMSDEDYEAFLDKMDAKWGPDWYARMTGNPELSLRSTPSSSSGNAPEPQVPPKAQAPIAAPVENTAPVAQPQQQPQSAPQKQQVVVKQQPAPVKTNQAPQKQAPQRQQAAPAPAPASNAPTKVDVKAGSNGSTTPPSTTPPPTTDEGLPWYNGIANWAKDNPELASGSAAALSAVPLYLLGRGFGKKRDRMLGLLTALLGGGAVYYGMKNWGTPWVAGHTQKPAATPAPEAQKGSNTVMPTNSYGFNPH